MPPTFALRTQTPLPNGQSRRAATGDARRRCLSGVPATPTAPATPSVVPVALTVPVASVGRDTLIRNISVGRDSGRERKV